MKLFLAPKSSLGVIRYLRSTGNDDALANTPMRRRTLRDAINSVHGLDSLDETAQRWLKYAGRPVEAYVPQRSKGTSTKRLITHVLGDPIPTSAFVDLGHDVCICTPQFAFMQIAATESIADTVRTGMELCGYYSRWRLEPGVMGDPYYLEHSETQSCTFGLQPVMHAVRLKAYVEQHKGVRGSVGSRTALQWLADNSASPMETAVYLLLCLPKRLGGYGLPKPTLNPKLIISNPDGAKERYPDLFWYGANIDVEYNSDSTHSGEWARYRDSMREVEFTVANYKVLPLTRPQLMDADEFDSFAQGLRRMLGIRARAADANWQYRRDELRRVLLADWQ